MLLGDREHARSLSTVYEMREDTMTTTTDIIASVQAMADELEAQRAHIDMLYRKRRQEASHLTSERVANRMVREELDASREMVREQTEALKQRDKRIAELEAMLANK